jgi:hypothetical protein
MGPPPFRTTQRRAGGGATPVRSAAGRELGGDSFDLDEGDQFAIDAQPVVGELAFDLVFGGEVGVLVEAQPVAGKVVTSRRVSPSLASRATRSASGLL